MIRFLSACFAAAVAASAAPPAATLTSGSNFSLNGKTVQSAGAPNWPVAPGDRIIAGSSEVTLTLKNGSRVVLAPGSEAAIAQCGTPVVQLFRGSSRFHAASLLEFCALGRPVRPAASTDGTVAIVGNSRVTVTVGGVEKVATTGECGCDAAAAFPNDRTKTIVAVAAAGGGATVATLAVAKARNKSKKEKDK